MSLLSGEVFVILEVSIVLWLLLLSYYDAPETCGHEILTLTILQQRINQRINKSMPASL